MSSKKKVKSEGKRVVNRADLENKSKRALNIILVFLLCFVGLGVITLALKPVIAALLSP